MKSTEITLKQIVVDKWQHSCRAVTFLPNGQRMEGWLPGGTYTIDGECWLNEGRGSSDMVPTLRLSYEPTMAEHGKRGKEVWYVGSRLLASLPVENGNYVIKETQS